MVSTRSDFATSIAPVFARHHIGRPFDVVEGPEYGADASAIAEAFPELPLVVKLHTPTFVIDEINELYRSWYSKARFVFGGLRRGQFRNRFGETVTIPKGAGAHTASSRNYGAVKCHTRTSA